MGRLFNWQFVDALLITIWSSLALFSVTVVLCSRPPLSEWVSPHAGALFGILITCVLLLTSIMRLGVNYTFNVWYFPVCVGISVVIVNTYVPSTGWRMAGDVFSLAYIMFVCFIPGRHFMWWVASFFSKSRPKRKSPLAEYLSQTVK